MRKTTVLGASVLLLFAAVSGVRAQSSSKRSTPKLTTEDVFTNRAPAAPPAMDEAPAPVARTAAPSRGGAIEWQRDLTSALDRAYSGRKLVVVDVYTDWCGWCKRMDATTYRDAKVIALSQEAVFLKLNAEDGGEGERFARDNGVTGYPTTIVLDYDGRALGAHAGYIDSGTRFVSWVGQYRGGR